MQLLIAIALALSAHGAPVLVNPGFEDGTSGWEVTGLLEGITGKIDPRGYGHISVAPGAETGFPRWEQEFAARPGAVYFAGASVLPQAISGGYGAYISVSWHDAAGKRISFDQSSPAHLDITWNPLTVRTVPPPGTATGRFSLLLNGHGDAYFDNATLVIEREAPAPTGTGPVTMTVAKQVVCENFLGFGAEDDGWAYSVRNCRKGVSEADHVIREARIRHMDPDWVRMFFWYKDWDPRGEGDHFTFDSPNMRSHYRTLDLYQELGTDVNVVGVEWRVPAPFGNPERRARSIGALLEHLVRERGYTCIKYWTLTNEPNLGFLKTGASFDDYVRIHTLVAEEIQSRGLDIKIVGADNTSNGLNWFLECVRNPAYHEAADVYASHVYLKRDARMLASNFFVDHLSGLQGSKPWIVAEFGFQDGDSTHRYNPVMESWDYALWTMAFVLEGLNRGVAGFNIWCLHEVYYPGGQIMNYGLWRYKNDGWAPKPVYHAWANFTRFTNTGDSIRLVNTTDAARANGAFVGDTFFWLNQSDAAVEIEIQETPFGEAIAYTENGTDTSGALDTLPDDDPAQQQASAAMTTIPIEAERFAAPPRSFGYLK